MKSAAEVVRQLLVDLGVADDPPDGAYPARALGEEDTPDDHITVYNTTAARLGRVHTSGKFVQNPGFQVRVRSGDETTALVKADAIRTALSGVLRRTVTVDAVDHTVQCVSQLGEVIDLGVDTPQTRRRLCTLNGVLTYKER